jgi:hypothetical protein
MLRTKRVIVLIALILWLESLQTQACTLTVGYFYQIPALKGQVVGTRVGLFQSSRWLRQSFARNHAKVRLYLYQFPARLEGTTPIKSVEANADGRFDFGPFPAGHYTLEVHDDDWGYSELFNVEAKDLGKKTTSVKIDVSPIRPDCKGGHEIVVTSR